MTIQSKLDEIYGDLESNVTLIIGRRDILFAIDMIYHSVLSFYFGKELIKKGWCEGLIIGDTRTGKSATIEKIIEHYGVGEKFTGEKVTFAGLVGGVQQLSSGRWTLTWALLPLNDRGLVAIDEAASESIKELIPSISNIRSSGVAEITAIQTAKTNARVRLIWSCNPRYALSQYDYGVTCLKDFATQQEDIARFDFALTASKKEVTEEEIQEGLKRNVEHTYTSEACRNLVMWAWTRKSNDIIIRKEVQEHIYDRAKEISKKYSSNIMLVEPHEQRIKVARLSIALACRLFATDDKHEKVIVTKDHVDFICEWLQSIYDKPSMAYDKFASLHQRADNITIENIEQIRKEFTSYADYQEIAWILLHATYFKKTELMEQLGWEKDGARDLFRWMSKNKLIHSTSKGYIKHPGFTAMLKEFEEAEELKDKK